MTPSDLHEKLGTSLRFATADGQKAYSDALSSLVTLVGDEEVEAFGAWFDYGSVEEYASDVEAEVAVHVRLLTASGIVTLDHEFSFDGAPDARFIPWSRFTELRVIARNLNGPIVRNLWLETSSYRVEFAGVESHKLLSECVRSVRRHLR